MTEDKQSITAMVELVSGALRMLSKQVDKIEKRLDKYHTWLKILEDDFDKIIDKNTAMPSSSACCDHDKCKKRWKTRFKAIQL